MKTATRKRLTVRLRESFASGQAARVDRQNGIVFGVKILGKTSPNSHGLRNVEGSDYTPECRRKAIALYEGCPVNVNHPPRDKPGAERSVYDRLGVLRNVREGADGCPYGDLHMLPSHSMAGPIMDAAERMPEAFALSHNALGRGEVRNGRYVVEEIVEARSVDVVTEGGTTRSLFESRHMKKTLRELLESSPAKGKIRAKLLEMGEAMPDEMALMEPDMGDGDAGGGDWKQSLVDAIGVLVSSDDAENHDMARKILAMLKPAAAAGDGEYESDGETVEDVEEARDSNGNGWNNDKERKAAAARMREEGEFTGTYESLQRELNALKRKDAVRDLCEAEGVKLAPAHFKAACLIESEEDRREFVQGFRELRESYPRSIASTPRTGGSRINGREVKDAKTFAESLLN